MIYLFGWMCLLFNIVMETFWRRLQSMDTRECNDVPPWTGEMPFVTIQLPVCNELYVVERLIDRCCSLDYPKDRLEIQVLDDSTDETTALIEDKVEEYAGKGFEITRLARKDRAGFKGGNLQHGLASAKGDFLAVFDADCVPDRDFILKTLPYFLNPTVGVVYPRYVRHMNGERSILTRAQDPSGTPPPAESYRYCAGRFFTFFFGSPGLLRKACLVDVRGWEGDTLCEDEDFSIRSYLKGWQCILLEERLAGDEVHERMDEVKHQLVRWKKGNAECYTKYLVRIVTSSQLTPLRKLSAIAAIHAPWLHIPSIALIALASVPLLLAQDGGGLQRSALALPSLVVVTWLSAVALLRKERLIASLLLQIGLSPRVSWGVLKGLLRIATPFVRSTKLNSTAVGMTGRRRRELYQVRVTPGTFLEGGLALYFAFALYVAFRVEIFWLVPFHLLCLASFSFVFALSVLEILPSAAAHKARPALGGSKISSN